MNLNAIEAYPLHWPPHRKRTKYRQRARFHRSVEKKWASGNSYKAKESLTVADSRDRLLRELGSLGAKGVIISSNLELRNDGLPRSGQREPFDPGVAVYFQMNKLPHCLSCDTWDRCADNLAAIAKHVEAMRGQLRWGVADVAIMFAGFKALPGAIVTPEAMSTEEAARLLSEFAGQNGKYTWANINADVLSDLYRDAARKLHPDANGGQELSDWHRLQRAVEVLRQSAGSMK